MKIYFYVYSEVNYSPKNEDFKDAFITVVKLNFSTNTTLS